MGWQFLESLISKACSCDGEDSGLGSPNLKSLPLVLLDSRTRRWKWQEGGQLDSSLVLEGVGPRVLGSWGNHLLTWSSLPLFLSPCCLCLWVSWIFSGDPGCGYTLEDWISKGQGLENLVTENDPKTMKPKIIPACFQDIKCWTQHTCHSTEPVPKLRGDDNSVTEVSPPAAGRGNVWWINTRRFFGIAKSSLWERNKENVVLLTIYTGAFQPLNKNSIFWFKRKKVNFVELGNREHFWCQVGYRGNPVPRLNAWWLFKCSCSWNKKDQLRSFWGWPHL